MSWHGVCCHAGPVAEGTIPAEPSHESAYSSSWLRRALPRTCWWNGWEVTFSSGSCSGFRRTCSRQCGWSAVDRHKALACRLRLVESSGLQPQLQREFWTATTTAACSTGCGSQVNRCGLVAGMSSWVEIWSKRMWTCAQCLELEEQPCGWGAPSCISRPHQRGSVECARHQNALHHTAASRLCHLP